MSSPFQCLEARLASGASSCCCCCCCTYHVLGGELVLPCTLPLPLGPPPEDGSQLPGVDQQCPSLPLLLLLRLLQQRWMGRSAADGWLRRPQLHARGDSCNGRCSGCSLLLLQLLHLLLLQGCEDCWMVAILGHGKRSG